MTAWRAISRLWLASGLLLTACAAATPSAAESVDRPGAQETLTTFLGLLADGQYDAAAAMYGGPLDSLQTFNPELDPQDVAGLIGYACGQQLLQCLPVRSVTSAEPAAGDALVFNVEFSLQDGSLFVLGPCCGATATEMPPISTFPFRVRPGSGGNFTVLDLPPYVP